MSYLSWWCKYSALSFWHINAYFNDKMAIIRSSENYAIYYNCDKSKLRAWTQKNVVFLKKYDEKQFFN